eukprot:240788-Rhodomonas_salina.1
MPLISADRGRAGCSDVPPHVRYRPTLCCYALCGTGLMYAATRCAAMLLRMCYAMSGTDLAYAATAVSLRLFASTATALSYRDSVARCGMHLAYGATQVPVDSASFEALGTASYAICYAIYYAIYYAISYYVLGYLLRHVRLCSTSSACAICYAMSYAIVWCYAICGTELAYRAMHFYALSGTEIAYGATKVPPQPRQYYHSLRTRRTTVTTR